MGRRTTSLADIARAAGVSHSTVSRALHDNPLISTGVREHIQNLAREMGYTPNAVAQSLQMQRTNTIGLVVTSIADPFLGDVARGVEEVAREAGLSVFLSASHNDPEQEMVVIETFQRRRVDGIIVADSRISQNHTQRLMRADVPTVLVNSQAKHQVNQLHLVAIDDYHGARLVVEHLLELGHRAIGYLGAGNRPKTNQGRLEGYRDALADAGIIPQRAWVVQAPLEDAPHEDDVAAGRELMAQLHAAGVTAIFCYNDMIAIGVLAACKSLGIAVPEQLSVVGFDDITIAEYVTPPLTTVHQPKIQLGRLSMRMLLDLLDQRPVQNHVVEPTLIVRASTAARS